MSPLTFQPTKRRVLVQPVAAPKQVGGILLPESARFNNYLWGVAIAVGPKCLWVKCGDAVYMPPETGFKMEMEGGDYILIQEEDLLAKQND